MPRPPSCGAQRWRSCSTAAPARQARDPRRALRNEARDQTGGLAPPVIRAGRSPAGAQAPRPGRAARPTHARARRHRRLRAARRAPCARSRRTSGQARRSARPLASTPSSLYRTVRCSTTVKVDPRGRILWRRRKRWDSASSRTNPGLDRSPEHRLRSPLGHAAVIAPRRPAQPPRGRAAPYVPPLHPIGADGRRKVDWRVTLTSGLQCAQTDRKGAQGWELGSRASRAGCRR